MHDERERSTSVEVDGEHDAYLGEGHGGETGATLGERGVLYAATGGGESS